MENPSVEQEIAQLEKQIAEKRASIEAPHEKEILRQVVGEKIQEHAPQYQPAPAKPQQDDDQSSYNDPQLADKIQEFVNLAFSKSIDDAVRSVVKTGNPALIDAFHDVLVDKLYDTLLERNKLEEVK